MNRIMVRRALTAVLVAPLGLAMLVAPASAAPKQPPAVLSVFHAIPLGKGADVVDVYAGVRAAGHSADDNHRVHLGLGGRWHREDTHPEGEDQDLEP